MFFEIADPAYENLPFLLTTVGMQRNQPVMNRPGGLNFHQFLYVTEGKGLFRFKEREFVLRQNQGVFSRRALPLYYAPLDGAFATAWLTFRGSGADQLLNYFGIQDLLTFEVSDQMIAALTQLEHGLQVKPLSARSADGYAFVLNLFETLTMPRSLWSQRVRKISQYLDSHFDQQITLDQLADTLGTDRFTLCRRYKQFYGVTVIGALREIRMAKAKEMLNGQLSVQQITAICGFESPSYFGKLFKQETGMTPGEYRRFVIGEAEAVRNGEGKEPAKNAERQAPV